MQPKPKISINILNEATKGFITEQEGRDTEIKALQSSEVIMLKC